MLPVEAGGPDAQQLLEVLLHQTEQRRLTRPPRPVDPASDLHAQPQAGGRVAGTNGGRTARLSRGQASPKCLPGEVRITSHPVSRNGIAGLMEMPEIDGALGGGA